MNFDDKVPLERVEAAFKATLNISHDFLVNYVLAGDWDAATIQAQQIRFLRGIRSFVRLRYRRETMTLGELKALNMTPPYESPRPTAWEKLLDGVE